jgi:hypothetical protein
VQGDTGNTERGSVAATSRGSAQGGAHFQMFAATDQGEIRWRLLSGNNRDLGRGVAAYADAESCRLGIKQMLAVLDELVPQVRRGDHLWQWSLLAEQLPVISGGHAYDRQIRCEQALAQFRTQARDARPADSVMLTASRRWVQSSDAYRPLQRGASAQVREAGGRAQ